MAYKIRFMYPNGDEEISEDSYKTEAAAISAAEDDVLGFATGAEILEDMGEDFISGSLEYEIFKD